MIISLYNLFLSVLSSKSWCIYSFHFLFLISTETVCKVQRYCTRIESCVHIQILPFETYFHIWHTAIKNITATCSKRTFVFGKIPFHSDCKIECTCKIQCSLYERCLYVTCQLKRKFFAYFESIVKCADKHPFLTVKRYIKETVTFLISAAPAFLQV